MPRMRKQTRKRNMSVSPTMSVATQSMNSVERTAKSHSQEPMSSVERGAMGRSREEMSSTTRTATKRRNTSTCPPCAKRHRAANSRCDSDSEDDTEEPDDTPLTKANIPTIVIAVLSNISTEGTSSRNDSQDVSHLGE